ncbi:acylneuraminate cytidylyltransferase family protein [Acinetobacter faecalis]|uniref:acylneuraminate cytidylyltransferase family protein n=1 Tax=Acinetobacter faecalis TaxID=2665161 RepID=UPI002A915835|nr:acylneuraminate cytidylyltransferase family protein [Acinetobacter faecalis]MDY6531275.1 acylneuraminate cytidylyltransferase family protein [Acinetobacter faecalis]
MLAQYNVTAAIIPARGGSKRIPNKNMKVFNGKPMIQWTIEAALLAQSIDYVVVSSDNQEILDLASSFEGVIAVKRPMELANDTASINDAVSHAIDVVESQGVEIQNVMLLQPPCPLKISEDIDGAVKLFRETGSNGSVVSVTEVEQPSDYVMLLDETLSMDDFVTHLLQLGNRPVEMRKECRLNGVIYITNVNDFKKSNMFFIKPCRAFIMPRERSVDIDIKTDFIIAEALAKIQDK